MTVQILGLRPYIDKNGKEKTTDTFHGRWGAPSIQHLFNNIDSYLDQIEANDQWNLFYTTANCHPGKGRKMDFQEVILFDIDGIDVDRIAEYEKPIFEALGIDKDNTAYIFTGHGVHVIIMLDVVIDYIEYFDENRHYYKAVCDKINANLYEKFLIGNADTSGWSRGKLARLPLTLNKKKDREEVKTLFIHNNLMPQAFSLKDTAASVYVDSVDHISPSEYGRIIKAGFTLDGDAIEEECAFLNYCLSNQELITEPQWYALLSIVGRFEDKDSPHRYSQGHPDYSAEATNKKVEQALVSSGPRTCDNIFSMFEGCRKCPHFGKMLSPVNIKGKSFIATEATGFYEVKMDTRGMPKVGKACYSDLCKAFNRDYQYVTLAESKLVYSYTGTHYKNMPLSLVENYAYTKFVPPCLSNSRKEFKSLIQCTNLKDSEWESVEGLINFKNGVLDLANKEFKGHSTEYGFRYVLDYDYNPEAKCPRFDSFLREVTLGDQSLIDLLLEYMGYCFSSIDPSWGEKALVLVGEGSNGKSVFMDVLKWLAGIENFSALTIADLQDHAHRFQLVGKLFNLAEETPNHSLKDSSIFKNLVTGGETMVKMLYHQPFMFKNTAKLLFACNELPDTSDKTRGLFRRLLIVPFNAEFTGKKIDRNIRNELKTELAGIFNRVIEGYDRLIDKKEFTVSEKVEEQVAEYREETDPVLLWMDENVNFEVPVTSYESQTRLYSDFVFFCEFRNSRPMSYIAWSRRLRVILPKDGIEFARKIVGGKKTRVLHGCELCTDINM